MGSRLQMRFEIILEVLGMKIASVFCSQGRRDFDLGYKRKHSWAEICVVVEGVSPFFA